MEGYVMRVDNETESSEPSSAQAELGALQRLAGTRSSRRQFLRSAVMMGVSVPFIGSVLEACANSSQSGSSTPITLTVGFRSIFATTMQQALTPYKANNVTLKFIQFPNARPDYLQKLATLQLSNQLPDLLDIGGFFVNDLAQSHSVSDLVSYLKTGNLKESDFVTAFLNQFRPYSASDQIVGLPLSADATVIYVNKDLFKQANVPLPSSGWTWDDYLATAAAINKASGGKFRGCYTDNFEAVYDGFMTAFGTSIFDRSTGKFALTTPEALQAWSTLIKPIQDGIDYPWGARQAPNGDVTSVFAAGQVAMSTDNRADIAAVRASLKADWDVVEMPSINGKRPVGAGSHGIAISSQSQHKDAAWQVLSWFYTQGGIDTLEQTYTSIPPIKSTMTSGPWLKLQGPPSSTKPFINAINDATIIPILPGRSAIAAEGAITTAYEQVLLKKSSVKDAFTAAENQLNKQLSAT